jgi:hypothetical protein
VFLLERAVGAYGTFASYGPKFIRTLQRDKQLESPNSEAIRNASELLFSLERGYLHSICISSAADLRVQSAYSRALIKVAALSTQKTLFVLACTGGRSVMSVQLMNEQ